MLAGHFALGVGFPTVKPRIDWCLACGSTETEQDADENIDEGGPTPKQVFTAT